VFYVRDIFPGVASPGVVYSFQRCNIYFVMLVCYSTLYRMHVEPQWSSSCQIFNLPAAWQKNTLSFPVHNP